MTSASAMCVTPIGRILCSWSTSVRVPNADARLAAIRDWVGFLVLCQTPLPADDLAGYYRAATEQSIPIAAVSGWLRASSSLISWTAHVRLSSRHRPYRRLHRARRVCDQRAIRGITVVPHLWKTGISIAAAAHLAAATALPSLNLPCELCNQATQGPRLNQHGYGKWQTRPSGARTHCAQPKEALLEFKAFAARRLPMLADDRLNLTSSASAIAFR
jgi:hypothetical protein